MHPAIRTQADGLQEEFSDRAAIRFDDGTKASRDKTRQEDKDSTDINILLRRFGANVPQKRPVFGEQDFTLGLQDAIHAVEQAKTFWNRLPADIKSLFNDWREVLVAAEDGSLETIVSEAKKKEEEKTPNPPNGEVK